MKAFLLHPKENMNGNLRWPSRNNFEKEKILESLEKIRNHGYWASAFPEGDGITFSKEEYSPAQALEEFRDSFNWLFIEECDVSELSKKMSELLIDQKSICKALIPIRKLWIEDSFNIGDFKFWSPTDQENPWFEYFIGHSSNFETTEHLGQWDGDIKNESDLLHYPIIELEIEVNESDLIKIDSEMSSEIRLIRLISEQADRALDLLRITHCHYKKIEYLPDRAGQLSNGFTVVYIIPEQKGYSEKLLQHIVYPIRTSNNWLGLEAGYSYDSFIEWLARVLKGDSNNEIEQSIRSSIIALNQAFYTIYDEARFLSLVFALDALCSPDPKWTGWKHRSYIAAILSSGSIHSYESDLEKFEFIYTDIRNKLVHAGASYIDIDEIDSFSAAEIVRIFIMRCIKVIYKNEIKTIEQLRNFAIGFLRENQYQQSTNKVIDHFDNKRGKLTQLKNRPNWQ